MKKKMSRVEIMDYSAIIRKGHGHKSKKDFDRIKLKKKLAKEVKSL